jgi:hypothetical protein
MVEASLEVGNKVLATALDPKKAAKSIVQLANDQRPPLRLLLGSDAYNGAEKNDLARLEQARAWKELSLSTDFVAE